MTYGQPGLSTAKATDPKMDCADWFVQCPHWRERWPWLLHCTTTRHFPDGTQDITQELHKLQHVLGADPLPVVYCRQRHTNKVGTVGAPEAEHLFQHGKLIFDATDAVVSSYPNVALAVYTADCVPLLFVAERTKIIGMAHAGWRGSFENIASETVRAMLALGATLDELHVWIGPAIRECCYEVSEDLAARFLKRFCDLAADGEFCRGRYLNLPLLNELQLRAVGVRESHIVHSGHCTCHENDRFFSYRAEGQRAGRLISMIAAQSQSSGA